MILQFLEIFENCKIQVKGIVTWEILSEILDFTFIVTILKKEFDDVERLTEKKIANEIF